jgi:peptidoglycan/xylan/chitin deacetylase (PgdA/CDA1 family)
MFYLVRTPWVLKKIYPTCVWNFPTREKKLYLSFDDGPHPVATPFVLEQLKRYDAKATFFCIGKNVAAFPEIFARVKEEGHAIGNHTHNHLNGWKTADEEYFKNIGEAHQLIQSRLFRPPYGKITQFQIKSLQNSAMKMKIIMWTVLSADFDQNRSKENCLDNVTRKSKPGDIVLFHDSEKAFEKMSYALPAFLKSFTQKGYKFEAIMEK